jgi:putative transposase
MPIIAQVPLKQKMCPTGSCLRWGVYNGGRVLRRIPHAVYDMLHHLVCSPQDRREVLHGALPQRVQELCADSAAQSDITLAEREVRPDPRPLCCSCPPPDSMAPVGTRFKRVRARAILREFPRIKRRLWGGALWEEGYGARTVGDKVTAAGLRRDIQPPRLEKSGDEPLTLCASVLSLKAPPLAAGIFYFM